MWVWIILLGLSASAGWICARALSGRIGLIAAAGVPWFGLLACLLYDAYVLPYEGGGASMWPIAQLFAGTIAAAVGAGVYRFNQ